MHFISNFGPFLKCFSHHPSSDGKMLKDEKEMEGGRANCKEMRICIIAEIGETAMK